jgi:hypothetical protein
MDEQRLREDICRAFGTTLEEVDALDRHMGGPQQRARRQEDRQRLLVDLDRVMRGELLDPMELTDGRPLSLAPVGPEPSSRALEG